MAKFIGIKRAAEILIQHEGDVLELILDGTLPLYAHGYEEIKINYTSGKPADIGVPERIEPDPLSNPKRWHKDPYSRLAIEATMPSIVHTVNSNITEVTPTEQRLVELGDVLIPTAKVMALLEEKPTPAKGVTAPKGGKTEPITELINSFLDENYPQHNPDMFYQFVKKGLASKQANFPVDSLGRKPELGVYMKEPKRGFDGNTKQEFYYPHAYIQQRITKAKGARKKAK